MSNHFKIIIPLYNVEEWIKLTVNSVKIQSHKDFQCVLVNDISTDKSAKVIEELIRGDERFILINNEEKAFVLIFTSYLSP